MMIKKSFMAVAIFLTSTTLTAEIIPNSCSHDKAVNNARVNLSICFEDNVSGSHEKLNMSIKEPFSEAFPLHVKNSNSSAAEVIMVVLSIPVIVILLFSRFTKSAK